MAEYDTKRGIRVSGSGLAAFTARSFPTVVDGSVPGFFDRVTGIFSFYIPITPRNVDARLNQIADTYQYYAFRKLTMSYIPNCGSSQSGTYAYAMSQDSDQPYELRGPTQPNILQFNWSTMAPAWQPTSLTMKHTGSKLWDTNSASATQVGDVTKYFQGVFVSAYDATVQTGDRSETGNFHFTYVIDFYQPHPAQFASLQIEQCPPCGLFPDPCERERVEEIVNQAIARQSHHCSRHSSRRCSRDHGEHKQEEPCLPPHPLPLLSCRTEFPPFPDALMPVSPDLRSAAPHD